MAGDRVDKQHGQVFWQAPRIPSGRQGLETMQSAALIITSTLWTKPYGLITQSPLIAGGELFNPVETAFVVAADHKKLQREAERGQLFQRFYMVGIAHATAHEQERALLRVNAELRRSVRPRQLFG